MSQRRRQPKKQAHAIAKATQATAPVTLPQRSHFAGARNKLRQKKGAKRVKKVPMTVEQLDAEMDAYKAKSEDETML